MKCVNVSLCVCVGGGGVLSKIYLSSICAKEVTTYLTDNFLNKNSKNSNQ